MKKTSLWCIAAALAAGFASGSLSHLNAQTLPPGLVAAYGFSEGSGSATEDSSGSGNTGALSGATWTTSGRFGNALSFNGAGSRVDISDANSLDLTNGMTIEAWVFPATAGGWRTAVLKEIPNGLAYALYASDDASRPAVYINTGGDDLSAAGTASLPLNAWTHLAATYDGAVLRLFVNGAEAGSRTTSGTLRVSASPLRIGGNAVWNEYFSGRIDEVRVYNRALGQAEIQADMNTSIVNLPPDDIPPTAPSNLSATAASSVQINLSWTASTDNGGVTEYRIERCQGTGCSTFSQIGTATTASYSDAGVQAATSYSYRVRAADAAGNLSDYSGTAGATTQTSGLEPAGWYTGDMHVHRSCGGAPESIASMYARMSSENLSVLTLLADMGNGEVLDPAADLPRVNGQDDPVSTSGRIVHWDAEWHWDATYNQFPHQALGGHVVALGLTEAHQIWEEYTYPIFEWAHQQNAIAGFAHMQYLPDGIPQSLTCCTPIEYPVEVALGSADFISEDISGSESAVQAYYRLLNTGFRPGFTAGSDYPCNGGSDPGAPLTYVRVAGGQLTYRNWIEGIAQGRTVVSRNGHNEFLALTVNGSATPGDEVALAGAGSVPVTVTWTANQNLTGTIELVMNGAVIASRQATASPGAPATLTATADFAKSGWLAARRMGGSGHVVHTGAVFVTVANAPVRASVEDAEFYVQWMDTLLQRTSPGGAWSSYFTNSLDAAQARYQAAKALFQQIALEAAGQAVTLASITVSPASRTIAPGTTQQFTATGTYSDGSTQDITGQAAWSSSNQSIAAITASGLATAMAAGSTTISAALSGVLGGTPLTVQTAALSISTQYLPGGTMNLPYSATLSATGGTVPYTWSITGGSLPVGLSLNAGTGSISGTPASAGTAGFIAQVVDSGASPQTTTKAFSIVINASGPILIISSSMDPFSAYYAEILRAEGLNEFTMSDISGVTGQSLGTFDIVLLGEITLTNDQVTMLSDWIAGGGRLIAMRPDKKLAGLLGLADLSSVIANAYLKVDTSSVPGAGIVGETIQYHGTADRYGLNGAAAVATLYATASTPTVSPAVTLRTVGSNGGQAAAFAYNLARSVIYTRQGNPAWAGQERDEDQYRVIRSDDLFYGDASFDPQPDWVNLEKAAIPQADEQQRLLANLIIRMNADRKPLPRFWYLPHGLPAAVIMTGDNHGSSGTASRFDTYLSLSPAGCSVADWECIRATAYEYPDNPLTNSQASAYASAGFEIGLHVTTGCRNWTPSSLESDFAEQLDAWANRYSSLPPPVTNRVHCIAWSDYTTMPVTELRHGIRLDTNYYYWPASWVNDRPGFFTGSGMPMRFADMQGAAIDVYQATTQMTDESGQTYPSTIDTLLDRAIGPEGYYGVFTANMHTDTAASGQANAIVNSAKARGIPVVSARQMLEWLDGRNASTFTSLSWDGGTLGFTISAGQGANGLTALIPLPAGMAVSGVTRNGSPVAYAAKTVKGIAYAVFGAASGAYQVSYAYDDIPPEITGTAPAAGATGVGTGTNITVSFNEEMDPATITTATMELRDPQNTPVPASVGYDAAARTATLDPAGPLTPGTLYTATVKGGTAGVKDGAGNQLAGDQSWTFTTASAPAGPFTIWPGTALPQYAAVSDGIALTIGVKFRSDVNGTVTGLRFYKGAANTGAHVGSLWTRTGTLLATATFTNETASGWQQVSFPGPVAITAGQTYVASYYSPSGYFAITSRYFTAAVDNTPLHALADGADGGNGVYLYGNGFPTRTWTSNNYWVDVVFQP